MKIHLFGYPTPPIMDSRLRGLLGGCNSEMWHTALLWRLAGWDVTVIPTGPQNPQTADIDRHLAIEGIEVERESPRELEGAITVGFDNPKYLAKWTELKKLGAKIVWLISRDAMSSEERSYLAEHGPIDAYVWQSQYLMDQMPNHFESHWPDVRGHVIHGAFDPKCFPFNPRPHASQTEFYFGMLASNQPRKWSELLFQIYRSVDYRPDLLRARLMGLEHEARQLMEDEPSDWMELLPLQKETVRCFFSHLHCYFPLTRGLPENWPRACLEAMASGVPIVAEDLGGTRELIENGRSGFLSNSPSELTHHVATLAYNERERLNVAEAARERVEMLSSPDILIPQWETVFEGLSS